MHEWITIVDPTPATAATIHYCLSLGALVEQGNLTTGELAPYAGMREVGTFLVTEVAHGNNAAGVETIATYDRAMRRRVGHRGATGCCTQR